MTDELATIEAENIHVAALSPAEMVPAQHALIAWCNRKIQALRDEGDELDLHQKLAVENGWKTSVVTANLNRNQRRIVYYQKVQDALKAGYLLVPNMPVDVLAVRVKRAKQPEEVRDHKWGRFDARPEAHLPSGEGRYVDDQVNYRDESYTEKIDGQQKHVSRYVTDAYDEVDFPIQLTKPVVLDAAARAMALKIFDRIGRVQNGGGRDPILVGQLLDPRGNGRMTTFFIAWWVDTRDL
jgi:hypothetical protein